MFMAVKLEDRKPIIEILEQTRKFQTRANGASSCATHELTLEMSPISSATICTRYAVDKSMRH